MKTAKCMPAALVLVGLVFFNLSVYAEAPVSDLSTPSRRVDVSEGYASEATTRGSEGVRVSGGSDNGNLFRQVQQLQEEVSTLRGQLEEQANAIQKLKQQQQDDFANLDSRIAGGSASAASASPVGNAPAASSTAPAATAIGTATNGDGKEEYEAAYALLKSKDYDGASAAFKTFVNKYPNSEYAGNSWFWLGFVYQTKGDLDSAAKSFSSLIDRFPAHSKVDDAKYNLGKIYNQQGKTEQARALLKEVASGGSKSAPLAKSYLESM